jgi:hypothetical protein
MTLLRTALGAALILGAFVWSASALAEAPVEWYTDTGGGGALARPVPEARDGGAVAPQTATGPDDLARSDISATEPVHSARASEAEPVLGAPDSTPARPQPERTDAAPAQAIPTVTGGEDQDGSSAGPIADLPLTGLQLAIVAGAGLSLLLAGALLRPQRR